MQHLERGTVPHVGLVRSDQTTGQHQAGHAAVHQPHLDDATVADGFEGHPMPAELRLQVVQIDRYGDARSQGGCHGDLSLVSAPKRSEGEMLMQGPETLRWTRMEERRRARKDGSGACHRRRVRVSLIHKFHILYGVEDHSRWIA